MQDHTWNLLLKVEHLYWYVKFTYAEICNEIRMATFIGPISHIIVLGMFQVSLFLIVYWNIEGKLTTLC